MRIENNFHVPVPREQAWDLLTDVSQVATCLPGAKLTEAGEDGSYRGELGVKLGPVSMTFLGEMRFTELNAQACVSAP
jgi:carbon monoxide dehydrogenase subunit G